MTTVVILDLEFNVTVVSITHYDPGISSGLPEDCYPPEGGEIEWYVNTDNPAAEFIQTAIDNTDGWSEHVELQIREDIEGEPEPPEPWDD